MAARLEVVVDVIKKVSMKYKIQSVIALLFIAANLSAQTEQKEEVYKKRVLESTEIDFLNSYYTQDGDNAAVTGGEGTEQLWNVTPNIVVSMPLTDDDVLTIDAGVSAYSSASSSNINPFDGNNDADKYQASSGASRMDALSHFKVSYSHSSDDRNTVYTANTGISAEYDYFSFGFGGSLTKLFNQKNTEISLKANTFIDKWSLIYPIELRNLSSFNEIESGNRNSYSAGLSLSQILTSKIQGVLNFDVIYQDGLLSTPFQRVYFADVEDTFLFGTQFPSADDIERLPDNRLKTALGGNLNFYLNEKVVIRTFYRYYQDDWDIQSHTASIEVPVKLSEYFTIAPYYRFYNQSAADYFAPFNQHLSTNEFYTSDYDLSEYDANQYGLGLAYTDIFLEKGIWRLRLKSIDLKYNYYERNSGLKAHIATLGVKFVWE